VKITEVMSELTAAYIDWNHVLVNPKFIRNKNHVAWSNYSKPILTLPILLSDVQRLEIEKQFSFQVVDDGAIIQLSYLFDQSGDHVVWASLAYYGTTIFADKPIRDLYPGEAITKFEDDVESIEEDPLASFSRDGFDDGPVGWLRFDFDPSAQRGILHHSCHLHVPMFPEAHLVVDTIPSPRQFIEWIMTLCYTKYYHDKRLDQDWNPVNFDGMKAFNGRCFSSVASNIYQLIPHLRMPIE
jgi:hypothetical protein